MEKIILTLGPTKILTMYFFLCIFISRICTSAKILWAHYLNQVQTVFLALPCVLSDLIHMDCSAYRCECTHAMFWGGHIFCQLCVSWTTWKDPLSQVRFPETTQRKHHRLQLYVHWMWMTCLDSTCWFFPRKKVTVCGDITVPACLLLHTPHLATSGSCLNTLVQLISTFTWRLWRKTFIDSKHAKYYN